MHQMNRREFLQRSLALGAVAAYSVSAWPAKARHANDVIELGPGKIKVSRMAIGTGSFGGGHSSNQMRKLGASGVADLWWDGYDHGVFFWDSADSYGSHAAIKLALKKIPREKITILTKSDASAADKMKADLDRFRQEMGTDYIDIVLLHGRMEPQWDQKAKGAMDVLSEAKEKKLVRSVGISCHSVEAMKVASKSPWLDICMARINPAGVRMDAPTETVLPLLAALRRWAASYRAAETMYGNGYMGLLPRSHDRGNSTQRLPEGTRLLMNEFIAGDYETLKQKSIYISWIGLKRACEGRNIQAPSYKTFSLAVRAKAGFRQTLKRQGRRAAYVQEPFFIELDLKTPRHGDRPFEIGHIDHTELDVEVISGHTGQVLGRPWMTLLIDAFSRRVLAFHLTFDAPSYRSCMMILRECVRRHRRLPQIVVLDGGREFDSVYFETLQIGRASCRERV